MNLSLWAILTIASLAAVILFTAIAAVFVARLVRRPTLPTSEQLSSVTKLLTDVLLNPWIAEIALSRGLARNELVDRVAHRLPALLIEQRKDFGDLTALLWICCERVGITDYGLVAFVDAEGVAGDFAAIECDEAGKYAGRGQ